MSFDAQNHFTKENLDSFLKELGKEYRKRSGKGVAAEIVLVGGAAILANYGFREMTTDIDALIQASSAMKDAINAVGEKYALPTGWLNTDFTKTASYSRELVRYSKHYKEYSNILTVRTISAEYLIAMKLCSGRKYKNDMSDIIGILAAHQKQNVPITAQMIDTAVTSLYGSWDIIPQDSQQFIKDVLAAANYDEIYDSIAEEERNTKASLIEFEKNYPNVTNAENVNNIIGNLKAKRDSRENILKQLEEQKSKS